MADKKNEMSERRRMASEQEMAMAGHKAGLQAQSRAVNERKHNPQFYDKYTRSSIEDSEKWSHLANEYAAWLADDHVLSNRRKVFRLERQLLNKVRAEQSVAGATPGARLREKPLLNALAQDVTPRLNRQPPLDGAGQSQIDLSTNPEYVPPMSSEERTVMDDLASLATARHAMGVDQAGSESLTTATTESRTVHNEEKEKSGALTSVSGAFD